MLVVKKEQREKHDKLVKEFNERMCQKAKDDYEKEKTDAQSALIKEVCRK